MHKGSLSILTLFVAVVHSAPPGYLYQQSFTHVGCGASHSTTLNDGIIYLPPNKGQDPVDIENQMQNIIDTEMKYTYDRDQYLRGLIEELCYEKGQYLFNCRIDILSEPRIKIIPTQQLSDDMYCTTPSCEITYAKTRTISTTNSGEVGFSTELSAKPFGLGVSFTVTASLGFSETDEVSTSVSYAFTLKDGQAGYIAMANAQISAQVQRRGCRCIEGMDCDYECSGPDYPVNEIAYHESVVLKNGTPRGIVTFIPTV
jgi:hypothetical protein